MEGTDDRFTKAIAAFDQYHANDPNTEPDGGGMVPAELLYARRMSGRLAQFAPDASEFVKLAARCQHIGRWEIPRETYPMDKKGYLQWRNEEKIRHSLIAEKILSACGYDAVTIGKVKQLLLKKELSTDAEAQQLEDVACLVFLEHYLGPFARKHDGQKVVDILRKTLKKMTPAAKQVVKELTLSDENRRLIAMASSPPDGLQTPAH